MRGGPSRTAFGAAVHRALHQRLEGGSVFSDPFAIPILGRDGEAAMALKADAKQATMRSFMAVRSRFAEDSLAAAVTRGVRQVVILGAGLDTFGLRNPHAGLRVFEVDHPATQAWKRERIAEAGWTPTFVFAPVDFERQNGLRDGLTAAGFDSDAPAFFIWLGVVPYLTKDAIGKTLDFVAGIAGSEIVFDYSEPLENYPFLRRAGVRALAARTAAIGEPWLSYFNPAEISDLLRAKGFGEIEDLGTSAIVRRFFGREVPDTAGGHVLRARRTA